MSVTPVDRSVADLSWEVLEEPGHEHLGPPEAATLKHPLPFHTQLAGGRVRQGNTVRSKVAQQAETRALGMSGPSGLGDPNRKMLLLP